MSDENVAVPAYGICRVLLVDGWHDVKYGTFHFRKFDYARHVAEHHPAPPVAPVPGFQFVTPYDSPEVPQYGEIPPEPYRVVEGPLSAVLAVMTLD